MYEYMSWHVLLACIVSMYCTDCIVPFLYIRRGKLYHMGTVGDGGGSVGGGIERVQHPACTCCSGETRPRAGGGGGGAYWGVCRLLYTL